MQMLQNSQINFSGRRSVLTYVQSQSEARVGGKLITLFLDSSLGLIEQVTFAPDVNPCYLARTVRDTAISIDAAGILLVENYSSDQVWPSMEFSHHRALQANLHETEIHIIDLLRIDGACIRSASSLR